VCQSHRCYLVSNQIFAARSADDSDDASTRRFDRFATGLAVDTDSADFAREASAVSALPLAISALRSAALSAVVVRILSIVVLVVFGDLTMATIEKLKIVFNGFENHYQFHLWFQARIW
jgi:hypothetical protein